MFTQRSHIITKTCSFQLRACLNMLDILLDARYWIVKYSSKLSCKPDKRNLRFSCTYVRQKFPANFFKVSFYFYYSLHIMHIFGNCLHNGWIHGVKHYHLNIDILQRKTKDDIFFTALCSTKTTLQCKTIGFLMFSGSIGVENGLRKFKRIN